MSKVKDSAHLVRVAGVFLLGVLAFVALRAAVIPKSFGRYGPYRGDAIREITARPLGYAGHEVCEGCHPDVLEVKSKGVHAGVNCESCHGRLVRHARYYWLLLAESHLTRRLFGSMVRRIETLPLPAG